MSYTKWTSKYRAISLAPTPNMFMGQKPVEVVPIGQLAILLAMLYLFLATQTLQVPIKMGKHPKQI
jgi:hypothetical protein